MTIKVWVQGLLLRYHDLKTNTNDHRMGHLDSTLLQPTNDTFLGYWGIGCDTGEPKKQLGNHRNNLGVLKHSKGCTELLALSQGLQGIQTWGRQGQNVSFDIDNY